MVPSELRFELDGGDDEIAVGGMFRVLVSRWSNGGTGEWKSLENGSRWRMEVAGEWKSLENGRRWRMGVARELRQMHRKLYGNTSHVATDL